MTKNHMTPQELTTLLTDGVVTGLNRTAARVQAVAVPLTPFEYGDLKSSLVVQEATTDALESAVSSDLPYAVAQHERMDYQHKSGGPKFLENAVESERRNVEKIMGTAVQQRMSG